MENKIVKKIDDMKNKMDDMKNNMDDMRNKMDENIQKYMKELKNTLSFMMFHACWALHFWIRNCASFD
jgi:predicted  nucleic acid-binding Zn-ribbon protein